MKGGDGAPMGLLFKDDMLDEFGSMPLGFAPYGGADFGEVRAIAQAVGDGDVAAFVAAWTGAGERLAGEAEAALAAGHPGSARELFLRASVHYGAALRPIFGAPADPRLVAAYGSQMALFDRAMALGTPPAAPFDIPFDGARMRAYLFPAEGAAEARRPLLILTNGYDGTLPSVNRAERRLSQVIAYLQALGVRPSQLTYSKEYAPGWQSDRIRFRVASPQPYATELR